MSEDEKEVIRNEVRSKLFKTLGDNCEAYVCMYQIGKEWYADVIFDGNIEACKSMAQRCWEEFEATQCEMELDPDFDAELNDDDEED